MQKASDVAMRYDDGLFLGADTVAECQGMILGKPTDREHARQMLSTMRGRHHHVYTGVCLWVRPGNQTMIEVDCTELRMAPLTDQQLDEYLVTDAWEGKAGAFGYQDGLDWVEIVQGSATNVVGLPMELLKSMLDQLP